MIFPAQASNDEISIEQMREYLFSKGLFINYIDSLSNLEIENLYNNLVSGKSEITKCTSSYTVDPNQGSSSTYGTINQDNFNIFILAITDYGTKDKINKLAVAVYWQWNGADPAGRRDDLVHIYWEPSCLTFTTEDFTAYDFYTKHNGEYVEYNESKAPAKSTTRDMAVYTNVYSGFGVNRGGWCVFSMYPAKPMYKGDNYSTPIAVTYYHNKSLVPYINNFTITVSSIGLSINFNDLLTDTLSASLAYKYTTK